ncbi:hypothetical protein WKV44_08020 [Spirochaetia bacterium 38H-sp]|uniref:LVIVD repeat-containing protein n=1 Tax=Rarispira pelagica TaxID=3141764 RepID=A0ABU9UEU2_9SPIR
MDISDPVYLSPIGALETGDGERYLGINGNITYCGSVYTPKIYIFDISDLHNPEEIAAFTNKQVKSIVTLESSGNYLYALYGLGFGRSELYMIDTSDTYNPVIVATLNDVSFIK